LTWGDIAGSLRSVVAFEAVLLAPGYCFAWTCNLLGFRGRGVGERLAWSVAISFAVVTIAAILLGKYVSLTAVCWLAGICAAGFMGLVSREVWLQKDSRLHSGVGCWWGLVAVGVTAAWVLFVVVELVDVGVGSHMYLSVTVFDHALRAAFTDSVLRTGVPPANPIYWPGHAVPMRYYYFWYVLVAAATRLAGATARQAMIASSAWSGFGLASVVALYCKNFLGDRIDFHPSRKTTGRWMGHPSRLAIALGMLMVTGLDILPVIAKALARMPTDGDMEWWSGNGVCSWVDSMLWVPHHVAGLVCCLMGFLLVWMSKGQTGLQRLGSGVLAGLAFASAFGLSTWIAIAFALVMLVWMIWAMVWERASRGRVAVLLLAAAVASIALVPYLAELHGDASEMATLNATSGAYEIKPQAGGGSGGTHLLGFAIRPIIPVDSLNGMPWIARMAREHPVAERTTAGVLLLVPGYFVELGFYGFVLGVALWAMRRGRLDEAGRTAAVLAGSGLAVATFLRSTVIANNDFGLRSSLIMQFFLLLLAVLWWEGGLAGTRPDGTVLAGSNCWLHRSMIVMVWLGLAGTIYQSIVLRVYLPVEERLRDPQAKGLSEWTMALRQGFDAMDGRVAKNAVVQYNSEQTEEFFSLAQELTVRRQTARGETGCGAEFGGDVGQCERVEQDVAQLFGAELQDALVKGENQPYGPSSTGVLSAAQARAICGRLGVSDLVATRWDAVWHDPQGWVWNLPEVVGTYDIRVIDCASARPYAK
jgi:hypothetical protein